MMLLVNILMGLIGEEMKIYIDGIPSMNPPDNITFTVDDRQTIIQTDGGNVIQDYGHIASGDKITLTNIQYRKDDFKKIYDIWQNRTLITFIDTNNIVWENVRVKIAKYSYNYNFPNIIYCDIEIWMI